MCFGETDDNIPQIVRHHTVIVGVVSGLALTVAMLAVCATCHQSRRERRRLHKLSTTVSSATELPTPTHQRTAQLTSVDDRRVHDVTGTGSVSTAQNHQPHGWMGLANGGECIQRDEGVSSVSLGLTAVRRVADQRPRATVSELPADDLAALSDRTLSRGRKLSGTVASNAGLAVAEKHGVQAATTNTVISAIATIEKRPTSPSTDGARGPSTPSERPDVVLHDKFRYPPSTLAQQAAESTSPLWPPEMDSSPMGGRRICPGWSASVMPVVSTATGGPGPGRSTSGTLVRSNCFQTAPTISDWQSQRPASVRWTAAGSTGRRLERTRTLSATRSTSELNDDVRPRLGATHSIVF